MKVHKGQNSVETRCHGFLVLNVDVVFVLSWNLDVVAFSYLKKWPGITMSWPNWFRFSMPWTIERKTFSEVYPLFFLQTF